MKITFKLNVFAAALCAFFITQSSQAQLSIVQNPPSFSLYIGRTASMTVATTNGTPPLNYQWMSGPTGSGNFSNLANSGHISGVTTSNLVISNVSSGDAQDYVVVVTDNTGASVTSAPPATLTVVPMPTDGYGLMVMGDNPVAFWRLGETSGTTAYDYAGGFNGAYQGTFNMNQPGLSTNDDNASVYFNGVFGSDVLIPFNAAFNPAVMTVEAWAKPNTNALPTSSRHVVVGGMSDYINASEFQSGYGLELMGASQTSSDYFSFDLGSTNPLGGTQIDGPNVATGWSYLVGTYDGTNMAYYVNGQLVKTMVFTNFTQNIYPNATPGFPWIDLAIASIYDSTGRGGEFNGNICEVAVYNTALSSNQVVNHYAEGLFGGQFAPAITQQPQSLSLYAGETAAFSVQATGYFDSYQWMSGAHGSGVFTNLPNGGNVSGATTATLQITNISMTNMADYVLVITNPLGSATSSVVTLNLQSLPTDVYGADVLADSPLAYWRLNEASGTTAYDYVGAHNGTYNGGISLNQAGISSFDTTGAARFDGTSGYVQVPYSGALNSSNFTVECWVDPTGGSGNQQAFFANQNGGSGYDFFSYPAGPDQWAFDVSGYYDFGTEGVAMNQWTHVVGTFDGLNQVLYVNGVPVVTNQNTGYSVNTAAPLNIGAGNNDQSSPAYFWTGLMSEVAVYGTVLTPNQILKHYDLATTGTVPPPVITQQPQSLSLYSNLTASFSVRAQSLVAQTYQWMAGTTGSQVYTNLENGAGVSGATSSNLVITGISPANAEDYVVVVSNSSGSVTSSVATLTVVSAPSDTYGVQVLAAGPVAYWRMNETNGSVMHDYVGGHNGTYKGGVILGQTGISSYDTNSAVLFDGSSAYAQVPNSAGLNTPAFSIECWVNPNQSGNQMTAIANQDSVNGTDGYDLSVAAGSPDSWTFTVGATNLDIGFTPLNGSGGQTSQWTHVVATFQNSNTVLYIDGQMVATNDPAVYPTWLTPNTAWPFYIGAGNNDQSTPAYYWSGLINEVAVYSNALTPLQVEQHYAVAALGGYAPPAITQSPTNLQRYATMSASFTAQTSSFLSPVTYQWMSGATGSGVYTNLSNLGNISGATTTNLVITNLTLSNAADYVLVAENAAGSVTSSVATLSVQAAPTDAYGATVVAANPVAFWRLNETSGKTAFDYAGGYNGAYQGTAGTSYKLNQTGPGGHADNVSVYFGGAFNDVIIVPWYAALNPAPQLTVECWACPSNLPTGSNARKIIIGGFANTNAAGDNDTGYYLDIEGETPTSNDHFGWTVGSGQVNEQNQVNTSGPTPMTWVHLVGTYDGTTETLYTNGVKVGSKVVPYIPNIYPNVGPTNVVPLSDQKLYPYVDLGIGSVMDSTGTGGEFNGFICDAAIYNYALSGYQVLNQYNVATTGTNVAPPVFTQQPQSVTTNAGAPVSLVGQATFAQPLTYQWMVESNGVYLNVANGGNISGATTTTLVIAHVVSLNATNYELVASYPGVSLTSSAASVTVTGQPPPINLTHAYAGGVLTLNWTNSSYALQQATNVSGPWITTTNLSGSQVSTTNAQMFFRLVAP